MSSLQEHQLRASAAAAVRRLGLLAADDPDLDPLAAESIGAAVAFVIAVGCRLEVDPEDAWRVAFDVVSELMLAALDD